MSDIKIIDTGYLTATSVTGTQATRANSGTAITLRSVSMNWQRAANIDDSPIINTNSGPAIGMGSVGAVKITISGIIDRNTSASMVLLDDLEDLVETYGVKLLYYDATTDTTVGLTTLGDKNKNDLHKTPFFSGTTTPHLHVRATNLSLREDTNSKIRFTLELLETN